MYISTRIIAEDKFIQLAVNFMTSKMLFWNLAFVALLYWINNKCSCMTFAHCLISLEICHNLVLVHLEHIIHVTDLKHARWTWLMRPVIDEKCEKLVVCYWLEWNGEKTPQKNVWKIKLKLNKILFEIEWVLWLENCCQNTLSQC